MTKMLLDLLLRALGMTSETADLEGVPTPPR